MLLIETGLVLASLLVAFTYPSLWGRWFEKLGFEKLERLLFRLSRHRVASIILVGVTALVLRVALLPIEPIPQPTVHDEFSYFLMSDTFAHGRSTNPTHPMSSHFEAIYVNQKPTYMSKYFPAQGLLLATGQVIFGHPFWGVWLSAGTMCAVICWMLQGWFPPFWALMGALLALIRLGTFSYWTNSYFGGALPAIGGALVLGALPRIKRRQGRSDSLLFGLGLVLLASSRPLEGMIFSLPIVTALLVWIWNRKSNRIRTLARVLAPSALLLTVGFAAMLYYFWRTTGSPLRAPYQVNLETQDPVPLFPWQSLRPLPHYRFAEMRNFYMGWEMDQYELSHSHFVLSIITRAIQFYLFFLGPALTLPFLMLAASTRRTLLSGSCPNSGLLVMVFWVSAFGLLLPTYYGPTYAAALTSVIYALLLAAMQCIRRWSWHDKATGLAIVRSVPVVCLLLLLLRAAAPLAGVFAPKMVPLTWCSPHLFENFSRVSTEAELGSKPGLQLALVRYSDHRVVAVDWVQNLADIDSQKVVWARDMGPENEELIRYYKDRHVWLVEPDKTPPLISPYPGF
jgi:hypothetical protein